MGCGSTTLIVGVEEPEEGVEAHLGGKGRRPVSEMPLADDGGGVSRRLQDLGQSDLLGRKASVEASEPDQRVLPAAWHLDHVIHARTNGVPSGEPSGAGGRAVRRRRVAVRKDEPLRRETIQVGSGDGSAPVGPEITRTEIVEKDEDHVGAGGPAVGHRGDAGEVLPLVLEALDVVRLPVEGHADGGNHQGRRQ
jgi:hypothetical protein